MYIENIFIKVMYIPGKCNTMAYSLSRSLQIPDWHLSQEVQEKIFQMWNVSVIDLFATAQSAVVQEFAAQWAQELEASFVDAFSRRWCYSLAWIFPPPSLMLGVLQHLNEAQGMFIVLAPRWKKVFWRADLKNRPIRPPFRIPDLENHLVDLRTGLPPPQVAELASEA